MAKLDAKMAVNGQKIAANIDRSDVNTVMDQFRDKVDKEFIEVSNGNFKLCNPKGETLIESPTWRDFYRLLKKWEPERGE